MACDVTTPKAGRGPPNWREVILDSDLSKRMPLCRCTIQALDRAIKTSGLMNRSCSSSTRETILKSQHVFIFLGRRNSTTEGLTLCRDAPPFETTKKGLLFNSPIIGLPGSHVAWQAGDYEGASAGMLDEVWSRPRFWGRDVSNGLSMFISVWKAPFGSGIGKHGSQDLVKQFLEVKHF